MRHITIIIVFILMLTSGCDKQGEIGQVVFCTNSHLSNCVFSIELSVDGTKVDTLTAASSYSTANCTCPENIFIGKVLDAEIGEHSFYAKELNCAATNRINVWSGSFNIGDDNCETVYLNIIE